jgi:hypothetical protein
MAYVDFSHLKDKYPNTIAYCRNLKIGDKIKFLLEERKYTIKAKDDRYLICTKPFNLKKTCLYTIIDLERLVRGANNLVFNNYDYMVQEDIEECLKDLQNGSIEVSHRNCVILDVEMPQ